MSDSDIEKLADLKIEEEVEEDKPIKQIIKDAAKGWARAKGRQAFFWAVKNIKAQAKEKGQDPKKVKIPMKRASALRIGDITPFGELREMKNSPVEKGKVELTFVGDSGSVRQIVKNSEQFKVVERRSIRG